jgi:hypothetical protein
MVSDKKKTKSSFETPNAELLIVATSILSKKIIRTNLEGSLLSGVSFL